MVKRYNIFLGGNCMKKLLMLVFLVGVLNLNVAFGAEAAFAFSHNSQDIRIYISTNGESVLDWGDGNTETLRLGDDGYYSHTYTNPGSYTVTIKDDVVVKANLSILTDCEEEFNEIFEIDVTYKLY